jgi:general secretion pathway protein B
MSYVLEALRRAEADRHRGQIPDLHAPPATPLAGGSSSAGRAPASAWRWVGTGLLLALGVAAAVWWAMPSEAPRPAPEPLPAPPLSMPPAEADRRVDAPLSAVTAPVPPPVALPAAEPPRRAATRSTDAAGDLLAAGAPPQGLPSLVFGGAFDSPDARARMLIINGQVWREGDEPAPGLVLERIALHAAQFRYQGRRFELNYDKATRPVSRP